MTSHPTKFFALKREIMEDKFSGASQLTKKMINLVIHGLQEKYPLDFVKQTLEEVRNIHSEIIPLQNIAEIFKWRMEAGREEILTFFNTLLKELNYAKERITQLLLQTLETYGKIRIITLSWSSNVYACLKKAHEEGVINEVVVLESRPLQEGVKLAEKLVEEGIKTKLISDAALGFFAEKVDVGLTGADAITQKGEVINKVGTYPLALALRDKGKRFYVASETIKINLTGKEVKIRKRNPYELLKKEIKKLEVVNIYFDKTPPHLIDGIVTERKVLKPPFEESVRETIRENYGFVH